MNELSLGMSEVDVEHQLQVQLVESVRTAVATGRERGAVSTLLAQLRDASDVHFGSEEVMMRFHSWEGYQAHVEEHRLLLEALEGLQRRFEQDAGKDLMVAFDQLQAWLVRHIRGADRAFTEYVARGGLAAPIAPGP
jgi:hemerythrin-like metal-binding protein